MYWTKRTDGGNSGLISAGHDRSDGGLVTTLLEMAFAGEIGCGLDVNIPLPTAAAKSGSSSSALDALFSEEVCNSALQLCDARHQKQRRRKAWSVESGTRSGGEEGRGGVISRSCPGVI